MYYLSKIILIALFTVILINPTGFYAQSTQSAEAVSAVDSCNSFKISQIPNFPVQGYGLTTLKAFDVNHDGIKDLLVNISGNNKIAVQLGNGEGGISETKYFDAGSNPTDFDLGDFNGDGEIDIVVADSGSSQFSLLLGDGTGNFTLYAAYETVASPQSLKVGYYDGDNYLDVAILTNNSLQIFKGNSNLTFTLINPEYALTSPKKITSGDFNNDGKLDLVVAGSNAGSSEIRLYSGQGDDKFNLTTTISGIQTNALLPVDFDKDGKLDLIVSDYLTSKTLIYKGKGDGGFETAIPSDIGYFFGFETVDFNADGKSDLVTTSGGVYLGDNAGNFSLYQPGIYSGNGGSVVVGDFDSDNLPDLGIININSGVAISLILYKSAKLSANTTYYVDRPYDIDSADFNGDGRFDIVTVSAYNNSAHILIQDDKGGFTDTSGYFGLPVGGGYNVSAYSVTVGDFNGDNKPDFAVPDTYGGTVAVFIGNGDGTFITKRINLPATNLRPTYIKTGDFNNDGKLDIIVANQASRNYTVLLNDGAGSFNLEPGGNINPDSTTSVIGVGDVTNDGILDLVVGRPTLGEVIYLTGNGNGTFVRQPNVQGGLGGTTSLILTDLNNDKNLDMIIGGNVRMQVSFGVGNGGFFNPVSYPVDGFISDLELQDFDLDGIKDIIAASGQSNSILFFKGLGNGVFNQAVTIAISSTPTSLTSKDFNNDGKPDIAISAVTGSRVLILYNETNTKSCLSVSDPQISEGNSGTTDLNFTVSLSAPATESVSVDYKTVARTAISGTDFVQTSGSLTFPAGTTTQTVKVKVNGDVLDEDDETFALTLSNPVNAVISDAVGVAKITDDDETVPSLSIGGATVIEGSGGVTTANLPVTLSGVSGRRIKVQAATKDGTALAGQDYQPLIQTITFEPGEVAKTLLVTIYPDYRVENSETFTVILSDPLNVNLTNNTASVTITNDDAGGTIQFSESAVTVPENVGSVRLTVARTDGNASDISFKISTKEGTALEFQDYAPISGVLSFNANETSKIISIPILNDSVNEDTQSFSLLLENVTGGATLGAQKTVTVNILDDDPLPRLSAPNLSVSEGSNGIKSVDYKINLLTASDRTVSVGYVTQDGTAIAPNDFLSSSGSVNFAPGETSKIIKLSIVSDRIPEPDEMFTVVLSSPVNAEIANAVGTITITDDDSGAARRTFMDFDGDGRSDVSVYRPSNGVWYLLNSNIGFTSQQFGVSTDKIAPADYDGDGKTDIAVIRINPNNSLSWLILQSRNGFIIKNFGSSTDIPVPADYDGDGKADVAVVRAGNALNWYVDRSRDGYIGFQFGAATDSPVVGDYDGDGKSDAAVVRRNGGLMNWYINRSQAGFTGFQFGLATDKPVVADYDGDGKSDIAVTRIGNGNMNWYINRSNEGFTGQAFGAANDVEVPGDYDGDGLADIAVTRSNGSSINWYINRSLDGFTGVLFGVSTDRATENAYIP